MSEYSGMQHTRPGGRTAGSLAPARSLLTNFGPEESYSSVPMCAVRPFGPRRDPPRSLLTLERPERYRRTHPGTYTSIRPANVTSLCLASCEPAELPLAVTELTKVRTASSTSFLYLRGTWPTSAILWHSVPFWHNPDPPPGSSRKPWQRVLRVPRVARVSPFGAIGNPEPIAKLAILGALAKLVFPTSVRTSSIQYGLETGASSVLNPKPDATLDSPFEPLRFDLQTCHETLYLTLDESTLDSVLDSNYFQPTFVLQPARP